MHAHIDTLGCLERYWTSATAIRYKPLTVLFRPKLFKCSVHSSKNEAEEAKRRRMRNTATWNKVDATGMLKEKQKETRPSNISYFHPHSCGWPSSLDAALRKPFWRTSQSEMAWPTSWWLHVLFWTHHRQSYTEQNRRLLVNVHIQTLTLSALTYMHT